MQEITMWIFKFYPLWYLNFHKDFYAYHYIFPLIEMMTELLLLFNTISNLSDTEIQKVLSIWQKSVIETLI